MMVLPRLYAIADGQFGDVVQIAQRLLQGGARLIQLRNKSAGAGEFLGRVENVLALTTAEARIIVNDRVDVARISGAAGVHLGQTDLPPAMARKTLTPEQIVGFSTHNLQQALEADHLPVDYIAIGPIFPTSTRQNPDPVVGLEGLSSIAKVVHKPIVAIGGIKLENAREVLKAGAHSIAVIRDLLDSPDIVKRTREWVQITSHHHL
jgi:thiamine-phosphate pyrophosphorylase